MGLRNGNKEWTRTSISWRLEQRRHQGFEGYEPLRQREQDTLGTKKTSKNKMRQVVTERNRLYCKETGSGGFTGFRGFGSGPTGPQSGSGKED
jgi:hypothetical protein